MIFADAGDKMIAEKVCRARRDIKRNCRRYESGPRTERRFHGQGSGNVWART